MKSKYFLSLACILTTMAWAQDNNTACQPGVVIEADGKADEWQMEWLPNDDKTMSYNVCFDDSNLYLRMKTSDDGVKRKISVFGLTIWMDPNGKKKKKLGLRFPTGTEGKERIMAFSEVQNDAKISKMSTSDRAEMQKQLNKSLITDVDMMELIGLTDDPLTSSRMGISNGIKVSIVSAEENGDYVYEAIIPFKSFRLSKSSIADLGIGFETGKYVEKSQNNVPPPPQAGGQGAGGRSYAGGQRYGGGGRGGSQYRGSKNMDMMTSSSAWTVVKLK